MAKVFLVQPQLIELDEVDANFPRTISDFVLVDALSELVRRTGRSDIFVDLLGPKADIVEAESTEEGDAHGPGPCILNVDPGWVESPEDRESTQTEMWQQAKAKTLDKRPRKKLIATVLLHQGESIGT